MPDNERVEEPAGSGKLPLSGPAVASLIIGVLSLAALAHFVFCHSTCAIGGAGGLGIIIAFFLGINSIVCVCRRTASSRSLFFGIPPILLPPILIVCGVLVLKEMSSQQRCNDHLTDLGHKLRQYYNDNGTYPDPNKWCDLLIEKTGVDRRNLCCPKDRTGPCSYALNPDAYPTSHERIVVLFESKPGWNQHGGPELLDSSRHWSGGCLVVCSTDPYAVFVSEKDLRYLKWSSGVPPRE